MSILHLHRDVKERSYLSGVQTVLRDRHALAEEFARMYPGTICGWSDLDPHVMDIAHSGYPVASVEVHHNREEVKIYEHPLESEFYKLAERHGFVPLS